MEETESDDLWKRGEKTSEVAASDKDRGILGKNIFSFDT